MGKSAGRADLGVVELGFSDLEMLGGRRLSDLLVKMVSKLLYTSGNRHDR